ncbi:unnamed protein product [Mycena citricolor]|uniref:Uncharacterized protein n=1 Tax=Mycena citricolor TaxID=2018698 RepID=A0AAD2Q173_9AGAR|nr:unnamed protein product [Mycena citricolor]
MPCTAHPILKHIPSSPVFGPHPEPPTVHFPPSPSLTRTFSAYSSSAYDRSPIVVTPNACALPARGCPGRTYYEGKPTQKLVAPGPHTHSQGRSLHPRALDCRSSEDQEDEDDGEESDPERTPTRTSPYIGLSVPPPIPQSPAVPSKPTLSPPPHSDCHFYFPHPSSVPPLIPDLSSESDESDGFISPPPETAGFADLTAQKYTNPLLGMPPLSAPFPAYNHSSPSFVESPPSASPVERKRRRSPRRSHTPHPRSHSELDEDGYEEEDLPGSFSHADHFRNQVRSPSPASHFQPLSINSPPGSKAKEKKARKDKKEKGDRSVSSLCRSLTGSSFRDEEDGCLGGF